MIFVVLHFFFVDCTNDPLFYSSVFISINFYRKFYRLLGNYSCLSLFDIVEDHDFEIHRYFKSVPTMGLSWWFPRLYVAFLYILYFLLGSVGFVMCGLRLKDVVQNCYPLFKSFVAWFVG